MELRKGGDSNDFFFLAMAEWQLDRKDEARNRYERAAQNGVNSGEFHAEAAELLGLPMPPSPPSALARRARELTAAGQWDEAAALYDEALSGLPEAKDPWWDDRAGIDRAVTSSNEVYQRLAALRPKDRSLRIARLNQLGSHWQWNELPDLIETVIELDPTDHVSWYNAAAVRAYLADTAAYRRMCTELLTRFGDTADPKIADRVAKTCFLAPSAPSDLERPWELVKRSSTSGADHSDWFHLCKALGEYRKAEFESAIRSAQRCHVRQDLSFLLRATSLLVQAMAQHQLGRIAEAQVSLAEAHTIVDQQKLKMDDGRLERFWPAWLHFQVLRREADALIETTKPPTTKN